jgi:hypothetical protein
MTNLKDLNYDVLGVLLMNLSQRDQAALGATHKYFNDFIPTEAKTWRVILDDKLMSTPGSRRSVFSVASTFEKLYQRFLSAYKKKKK